VPILNKRYELNDIIKKQAYIKALKTSGTDSIYIFESDVFSDGSGVSEFLEQGGASSSNDHPIVAAGNESMEFYFPFPDSAQIDQAVFSEGTLNLNITNPSSGTVNIEMVIPSIRDQQGNPVTISSSVLSGNSVNETRDLENDSYLRPANQPDSLRGKFKIICRVNTSDITAYANVNLSISGLGFEMMKGKLKPKSLGVKRESKQFIDNKAVTLDENSVLKYADLAFVVNYYSNQSGPFTIEMKNLKITGKRNDGSEFSLKDSTGNSSFNLFIVNGTCTRVFNQSNSNITSFITFLPDSIKFTSEYVMNPDYTEGTVTSGDSLSFDANFSTKTYFALKKSSVKDTSDVTITQADRNRIRDGLGADINIQVDNAIPLTSWIKVDLLDAKYNKLFTLTKGSDGSDSLYFQGAETDGNGEAVGTYTNPPELIQLDSSQVKMLADAYHAVYSISMRTKDAYQNPPPIIVVRPSDWMRIKAYGKINYHVNQGK